VLYDYALWAAFCNIRLTHDTVSWVTHSRALVCGVGSSKSTEILLCAQGPDVARSCGSERMRKYFQKVGRNAFVLHS
jgi:hypothetical protein